MSENTRIPAVSFDINLAAQTMVLTFGDGEQIEVSVGSLSDEIRCTAMFHGLKQKLGDAAAIARNPETGRSATLADKKFAVLGVYDRIMAGSWNKGRAEGSEPTGGLLLAAICRLYPAKTPAMLREFLAQKSKEAQAQLRGLPRFARVIDEIRAERAKASAEVDEDMLLDGLE